MMKRFLKFLQRTYRTERTVVWECPKYLDGTYSYTSCDTILSTDLVDQALQLLPTRGTHMPLSLTDLHSHIRINAVF